MARGKKLDLNIGASFDDDWAVVSQSKKTISSEIKEPSKHFIHFKKEKRRGKVVTLAGVFYISTDDSKALLKKAKKSLGCGGSFKDSYLELQGDIKEKLKTFLEKDGFRIK